MKFWTVIVLLLGTLLPAGAQDSASATPRPLPPGPLLKNAPDFAQWVVTYKADGGLKDKQAKSAESPPPDPRDFQVVVTKTKQLYSVLKSTGAGRKIDKWCLGDLQVTTVPNAQNPILSTAADKDADYMDFSKTDFSGFEWVSSTNFAEIKNISGADCIIFRDRIPGSSDVETDVEAIIDLQTRLPVSLRVGDGLTTFQFRQAPSSMLAPPENVSSLAKQWRERLRRASLIPPP